MGDLLKTGSDWLEDMRTSHATRQVTYCRGEASVEVSATVGETVFRINDAYGAEVRHVRRDFLILADDLVLGGGKTLPERGDRVREAVGGKVYVHEVMGPGGNEPDWRYSDPYRTTLRIHTKEVGKEQLT
jgi:hypothetical protein